MNLYELVAFVEKCLAFSISIRGHRNEDFFPHFIWFLIGTINKRDPTIEKYPLYKDFKNG